MSDIVDKLRDWSYVPSSKEQKEVADEVESLRAENAALMETITSQDTLIISLKEERDRLVALDKESKAALDKFNRQLMRDNAILGARVGELTKQLSVNQGQNVKLKESIVQKNSDISSLVERDFANQRKIAYLMQRVDSMRGALEAIKEAVCGEHVGRWDTFDRVYTIRGGIADACDIALSASKVSNEKGDEND